MVAYTWLPIYPRNLMVAGAGFHWPNLVSTLGRTLVGQVQPFFQESKLCDDRLDKNVCWTVCWYLFVYWISSVTFMVAGAGFHWPNLVSTLGRTLVGQVQPFFQESLLCDARLVKNVCWTVLLISICLLDLFRNFYGCGSRIWTCDLRVMSPTSCQLLHPAMSFWCRGSESNRYDL